MALRFRLKRRFQNVMLQSGRIYNFAYSAYARDPSPMIIFLYWVEGNHPRTKRQYRFIQAINLNYISRQWRKNFVEHWVRTFYTTRNVSLTWNKVKSRFPEITFATRRYFYSPGYYIKSLRAIPLQDVEREIVGTMLKDFSTAARIGFWSRIRNLQRKLPSLMRNRAMRGR